MKVIFEIPPDETPGTPGVYRDTEYSPQKLNTQDNVKDDDISQKVWQHRSSSYGYCYCYCYN